MAAALLKFDPTRRRALDGRTVDRGAMQAPDGGAKIIFFTGVRVSRDPEAEANPVSLQDAEN